LESKAADLLLEPFRYPKNGFLSASLVYNLTKLNLFSPEDQNSKFLQKAGTYLIQVTQHHVSEDSRMFSHESEPKVPQYEER